MNHKFYNIFTILFFAATFFAAADLNAQACAGNISMPASGNCTTCSANFFDSGGSGGSYANNENRTYTICSSTAGQMARVIFSAFDLESNWDYLYIYDGNSTAAPLIGTYTGTTSPGTITATNAGGCLTFRFTSDGSGVRAGWAAAVSCVAPPPCASNMPTSGSCSTCSGNFFDSGGSGGNYGNSENRTYTICSSTAGQMAQVIFSAFSTEASFDRLEIFDGNSTLAPLIGTYSGTTSPGTVTATNSGGCLTFRFTSDGSVTGTGWAAAVSCVAPPPVGACAGNINMPASGSCATCSANFFDSGGSGGSYANNENRIYTICSSTAGQMAQVIFSAFSTEACCDRLEIFDGNSTAAPLIGTYAGTTSPGTVTATNAGGCLTFRFTSDGSVVGTGWAATIGCVAPPPPSTNYIVTNGSVTTCSGTLLDPGGTGNYSNNLNNTYTINPSTPGAMVRLVLTMIDLESCCDYIQIYNGPTTASPMLIQLAGNALPPITSYTSTHPSGALTVVFFSDGSVTGAGFSATISCVTPPPPVNIVACSGTFLDSGGSGGNYGNDENNVYTICPSTPGDRATVFFTEFNLENGRDYMYIYDGDSPLATSLGIYTGTTSPGLVSASPSNTTGCLTFRFTSDASTVLSGWSANIGCVTPCQTITASINTTPVATAGVVQVCQGSTVSFSGTGIFSSSGTGATYNWGFSDGVNMTGQNISRTFAAGGSYFAYLTITDPSGCNNTNSAQMNVQVSTTPVLASTVSPSPICLGASAALSASVTMTPYAPVCTPPVSGTTFLPDGSGVSYNTSINVNCYAPSQLITAATDISNLCINMEHSYLGDLNMRIICPNGQSTVLHGYPTPGGNSLFLGSPIDDDANLAPGTGLNYCFNNTSTTLLYLGPTALRGTPASPSINAGDYQPTQSFSNLVGCPVNGTWTLEITDNIGSDNGYIFNWDLNFAASIPLTSGTPFTPTIASQGWMAATGLTNVNATTANVVPTAAGTPCYTYRVIDNFGCTYTRNQCVTVNAIPIPSISGTNVICAGGSTTLTAAGGGTYSWSSGLGAGATKTVSPASTTTYTVTVTNASGCTATTSYTVTVNTNSVAPTSVSGTNTICALGSTTLNVNGGSLGNGATYRWYSGSCGGTLVGTGNSITVSPAATTTYFVRAEGSCNTTTCASLVVTVNTASTAPTIVGVVGTVCPNTNVTLTASGGTAGTGSAINWYSGPNGTGTLLGTGASIVVAPLSSMTVYARREGTCNTTADDATVVNTKTYIYAADGTTTSTYCTDNAGWHHFYVGDDIILSVMGNIATAGTMTVTIRDNGAYYLDPGNTALCATGWNPGEAQFEMERNWNIEHTGTLSGTYDVRYYFEPNERQDVIDAANAWIAAYPACGYTYKYPNPNGWFWFKNQGSAYSAPDYDDDATFLMLNSAGTGTTVNGINWSTMTGVTNFSGGTGAVVLIPTTLLPVEWQYFTGHTEGTINKLEWATGTEENTVYFDVQRSKDGINFETIGNVNAAGFSNEAQAYNFDDLHPFIGLNYYRLNLHFGDGVSEFSEVIVLENDDKGRGYSFYPNPAQDEVFYQFSTDAAEKVQIEVIDVLGRILSTKIFTTAVGANNLRTDMSTLIPGAYNIRVTHLLDGKVHSTKIIKK
jgi:subtilisin-like proprotein convertase family protein/putative hemolysin